MSMLFQNFIYSVIWRFISMHFDYIIQFWFCHCGIIRNIFLTQPFQLFWCYCKGPFCSQRCRRPRCPIPKQNEEASLESIGYEANFQNSCCLFHHDSPRILFLNVAQFITIYIFFIQLHTRLKHQETIIDETSFTSSM
jgi:hypothetical protein